jgi:hypothetical protein
MNGGSIPRDDWRGYVGTAPTSEHARRARGEEHDPERPDQDREKPHAAPRYEGRYSRQTDRHLQRRHGVREALVASQIADGFFFELRALGFERLGLGLNLVLLFLVLLGVSFRTLSRVVGSVRRDEHLGGGLARDRLVPFRLVVRPLVRCLGLTKRCFGRVQERLVREVTRA